VLGLPVEYEDERFTTFAVESVAGRERPSDDLAAAMLLQQFIDRRRQEDVERDDQP
jgi:RNase H-fold protein (predicted Holliday junction resolvase)